MLKKLRGEPTDWDDVAARLLRKPDQAAKRIRCNGCGLLVDHSQLTMNQPGRGKYCEECANTRVRCALCAEEKRRTAFPSEIENAAGTAVCWDCRARL